MIDEQNITTPLQTMRSKGGKTAQGTLPLKTPCPTADPNITEMSLSLYIALHLSLFVFLSVPMKRIRELLLSIKIKYEANTKK